MPAKRLTEEKTRGSKQYRFKSSRFHSIRFYKGDKEIQVYLSLRGEEHPEAISILHIMKPAVYILFNRPRGVLYTGVTNDLYRRIVEHKQRLHGFTAKYNVTKLGHCEYFQDIRDAILREKQIKAGNRKKKIELIESQNPEWKDLFKNEF